MIMNQKSSITQQELDTIIPEINDDSTLPHRLAEIFANYPQANIRSALTSNPNTPLDILFILGLDYPTQLLNNSAFSSYFSDNPDNFEKIPTAILKSILKLAQVPQNFIFFTLNSFQGKNTLTTNNFHRREKELLVTIIFSHRNLWNQWRRDNSEVPLSLEGINFQDCDLTGANLENIDLTNANLKDTNLKSANLKDTFIECADNLQGVKLDDNTQIDETSRLVWDVINNPQSERNLSNLDLRGVNLKSADLTNANLSGADLNDANLAYANLSGANLSGTDLTDAYLWGINLANVRLDKNTKIDEQSKLIWEIVNHPKQERDLSKMSLEEVNLRGADLRNADLTDTNLTNGSLKNADLRGANLTNAHLNNVNLIGVKLDENTIIDEKWKFVWEIVNHPQSQRDLKKTDLSYANLAGVDLRNANLRETDLSYANLAGADLSGADLRDADLYGVNLTSFQLDHKTQIDSKWLLIQDIIDNPKPHRELSNVNLSEAYLPNVDLHNANLSNSDLSNISLCGANLIHANLEGANLRGANLAHADLRNANLRRADLTDTYLVGADLRRANLSFSYLTHSRLSYAKMNYADLNGAGLLGVSLYKANLTNANLENTTLQNTNLRDANLNG